MKRAPKGMAAYRIDASRSAASTDDELVLFVWDADAAPLDRDALTAAEREVLDLVLKGASNASIAQQRSASVRTVANQVGSVLKKLGAGSRFELIARAGAK